MEIPVEIIVETPVDPTTGPSLEEINIPPLQETSTITPINRIPKMKDPKYKMKLDASYAVCINELCSPPNWEDTVLHARLSSPNTTVRNSVKFPLTYSDDIVLDPPVHHSYIFKRTHFYSSFNQPRSRLRRDLIRCWKTRGYYVDMGNENNAWYLRLQW